MKWERGQSFEKVIGLRKLPQQPSQRSQDVNRWLDHDGFSFFYSPTTLVASDWKNRHVVDEVYLPSMAGLLKTLVAGADRVENFDWRVGCPLYENHRYRANWIYQLRSSSAVRSDLTDMNDPTDPLTPASQVHLDQPPKGVLKRVRLLMGDQADFLLKGRVRVIKLGNPKA